MLVIELTYKKPMTEADKYLEEHRKFLDNCYQAGVFIASGVKVPRDGGIILANVPRTDIDDILKEDPFYQHDIADYVVKEFIPSKYCELLKPLFS